MFWVKQLAPLGYTPVGWRRDAYESVSPGSPMLFGRISSERPKPYSLLGG